MVTFSHLFFQPGFHLEAGFFSFSSTFGSASHNPAG
jgi:hypothetical protein